MDEEVPVGLRRDTASQRPAGPEGSGVATTAPFQLKLLGRFNLSLGRRPLSLGLSSQRLLAFLALDDGPVVRTNGAAVLWPDVPAFRANANLRGAVWRLQRRCPLAIHASFLELSLASCVLVDVRMVIATARRLIDRTATLSEEELSRAMRCNLYDDLLPDWLEDDWLAAERERFRQLRLHALEGLCERMVEAGWYGAAVDAVMAAVAADPFRESAQHLLIRAHLAEGNHREALQQYESFHCLLRDELGLEPSEELRSLLYAG